MLLYKAALWFGVHEEVNYFVIKDHISQMA
jgi:hypothetical protein